MTGIVNILQRYDLKRASQSFMKSLVQDKRSVAVVHPRLFSKRFVQVRAIMWPGSVWWLSIAVLCMRE